MWLLIHPTIFMAARFQVHAGVFVLPCLRNSCNCFIFWTTGLSLQSRFDLGVVSSVVFVSTGGVTTVPCTNISSFEIGFLDHSRFNSGVVALIALGSTDGVTALLCISISSFEIGLLDNSVISKEMTSFKIILFCSAVMRFFGLLWQLWLCFYDTFSPICVSYICTWSRKSGSIHPQLLCKLENLINIYKITKSFCNTCVTASSIRK